MTVFQSDEVIGCRVIVHSCVAKKIGFNLYPLVIKKKDSKFYNPVIKMSNTPFPTLHT